MFIITNIIACSYVNLLSTAQNCVLYMERNTGFFILSKHLKEVKDNIFVILGTEILLNVSSESQEPPNDVLQ